MFSRLLMLSGHYGSGKTNIAINLALRLRQSREPVTVADLDIVNPYFRASDSFDSLRGRGIRVIASPFAGSNVDLPALPASMYSITDPSCGTFVVDIGGDDRGALVLGRLRSRILAENNYEMLFVINGSRPLTRDAQATLGILHEIEAASGIPFTAIVNNTNLGPETAPEDVLRSLPYAERVSSLSGLPIRLTTVMASLYETLSDRIPNLFPLDLQPKII